MLVNKVEKFKKLESAMRSKFMKEIMNYKQSSIDLVRNNINKILKDDEMIQVSYFDATDGMDADTLEICNSKVEEVKLQSEQKLSNLITENGRLNSEIIKY